MREILFRAKALHDGSWVYGDPIHSKRMAGGFNEFRIRNQETGMETDIDPETLGQFNGQILKDEKVFTGNIIDLGKGFNGDKNKPIRVVALYDNSKGCFYYESNNPMVQNRRFEYTDMIYYPNAKIIGNIFDNPELLKKAT